jgi:hypothetical protein
MSLEDILLKGVKWNNLAQDRDSLVNTVISLRYFIRNEEFD